MYCHMAGLPSSTKYAHQDGIRLHIKPYSHANIIFHHTIKPDQPCETHLLICDLHISCGHKLRQHLGNPLAVLPQPYLTKACWATIGSKQSHQPWQAWHLLSAPQQLPHAEILEWWRRTRADTRQASRWLGARLAGGHV